jgi:HAD superfamily hydrolase (TIGR01549 family)
MRLEALILDIDGTLVDSNDKHTDCWVEAFAYFGKRVDWNETRQHIGKGGDLLVPDMLDAREMRRFGQAVQKHRGELWKSRYMNGVRPFEGAREAIRELHGRGLKLVFASSADPEEVEYYVELLGAAALLEGTTSKEDARFSKPSPEIFEAALQRAGGDETVAMCVGDTPYDVLAAHRSALPIAAVLSGGFPRGSLSKAEFLYDDIAGMVKELDRIDDYFRT